MARQATKGDTRTEGYRAPMGAGGLANDSGIPFGLSWKPLKGLSRGVYVGKRPLLFHQSDGDRAGVSTGLEARNPNR